MVKNGKPQLRPEFAKEIERAAKNGKFVEVKDFGKEYVHHGKLECFGVCPAENLYE